MCDFHRNFAKFLWNFKEVGKSTRFRGKIYVRQKWREVLNLDLENYLQSYDVILGLQIFYDPISCGTNIARGTNHKLLNGGVDLGLER